MNEEQLQKANELQALEYPYTESKLTLVWIKDNARFFIISPENLSAIAITEDENCFIKGYQRSQGFPQRKGILLELFRNRYPKNMSG
jgi:hypothetical protein